MSKRVGYFGGSFDPIHLGHLHLAIELAEKHQLSEVYFCPTSQSPHKKETPPMATKEQRRAMVTAAISPLPQFTLLDLEIQTTTPCYTVDTLQKLVALDGQNGIEDKEYFLLLGEDALERFHTWKDVEELVNLASPLVGSRDKKGSISFERLPKRVLSKVKKGLTSIPALQISSTQIRERLQQRLYCGHLLPAKVWDYIQQHQLYRC